MNKHTRWFVVGLLFLVSCSEILLNPTPVSEKTNAELVLSLGAVGTLGKAQAVADLDLTALFLTLSAQDEATISDTIPLSGNARTIVRRTISGLSIGKQWTISAYTHDRAGQVIHQGVSQFRTAPGEIDTVYLELSAKFSKLIARFHPVQSCITRISVMVDGNPSIDSLLTRPNPDTVSVSFPYVPASDSGIDHTIELAAFAQISGSETIVYSGAARVRAVSGQNKFYSVQLSWVGPDISCSDIPLSVRIGALGTLTIDAEMLPWIAQPKTSPFEVESTTVLLFDFNGDLVDRVAGKVGNMNFGGFETSPFGQALRLGSAEFGRKPIVRVSHEQSLNVSTISMEALVYVDTLATGHNHIIDKSWTYGMSVYGGNIACHFAGSGMWWYSSVRMPVQKWTYVCATYDGITARLYLDGRIVDSTEYAAGVPAQGYEVGIGNAAVETHNVPFLGRIDAIRISSAALSSESIAFTGNRITRNSCP